MLARKTRYYLLERTRNYRTRVTSVLPIPITGVHHLHPFSPQLHIHIYIIYHIISYHGSECKEYSDKAYSR